MGIKKSDIKHGAIFAIPLWNNLGFFYAKMLWGTHLKNEFIEKREVFIRVYDFHTKDLVTDFEADFFKDREIFVDPFILSGFPNIKGDNSWKFIRHDPAFDEDDFIPHYWNPGMLGESNIPDDKVFNVIKYGNTKFPVDPYPYHRIKHLPIFRLRNFLTISIYLTIDWLKRSGQDVDAPFDYKKGIDEKKAIRFEVTHYTQDYRTIPKGLRGRIAPETK